MRRPSFLVPTLVLAFSALAGCMASEPTSDQRGTIQNVVTPDFAQAPDMAPAGPVQPPVLSGLPTTSMYTAYPVSGHAGPTDTVIIDGTATGSVAVQVNPDGSFCGVVQLTPNATTTMTLHCVDQSGNESSSITLTVTQSGSPQGQGMAQPSVNAALQGTGSSTYGFINGTDESAMHDGDAATYAQSSDSQFSSTDTISLQLAQATIIQKINIKAPSSCALTAPFTLFISNESPSATAGPGVPGWTAVMPAPMSTDSSETEWTVSFTTPPTVQSISIYFDHSLVPTGSEENCGSYDDSDYQISEIEAWTVAGLAPPPPGAPSCG
jgi:hypothetical protein